MLKNKPIKIGILEASPQTKAILEFFFSNSGKSIFKESNIEEAAAFIIDYDYPGSKEHWQELYKETKKPGILASTKEIDLNSTFWVAKPLTSKDLIRAGQKVQELLEQAIVAPAIKEIESTPETIEVAPPPVVPIPEKQIKNATNKHIKEEKISAKESIKYEENIELAFSGSDESQLGTIDFTDDFEGLSEDVALNVNEEDSKKSVDTANFQDDFLTDFTKSQSSGGETERLDDIIVSDLEADLMRSTPNTPDFSVSPTLIKVDGSIEETPEIGETLLKEDNINYSNSNIETQVDKDYKLMEESEIDAFLKALISGGKSEQTVETTEFTEIDDLNILELSPIDSSTPQETVEMGADLIDFAMDTPSLKDETSTPEISIEDESQDTKEILDLTFELPSVDKQDDLIENESFESKENEKQSIIQDDGSSLDLVNLQEIELENKIHLENNINSLEVGEDIVINSVKPKEKVTNLESAEDELQNLLEEVRKEAEAAAEIRRSTSTFTSNGSRSKSNHIPTSAEERWALTCGTNTKITNNKELKEIAFNPEDYLLSAFLNVCEQSKYTDKIMRLKIRSQLFIIDYNRDFVYHDKPIFTDAYAEVCQRTVNPVEIKIHNLDHSEQRLYQQKIIDDAEHCHSVDSFIWTTSLLVSRGRLPLNTDINKKVGVKHWPNLTRLEQIPNGIQIAAVFYKHPGSLVEISSWSKIDQRYIFAFYNASLSLELLELDDKKIKSTPNLKGSAKKNKDRGFFSRLLKRIKS